MYFLSLLVTEHAVMGGVEGEMGIYGEMVKILFFFLLQETQGEYFVFLTIFFPVMTIDFINVVSFHRVKQNKQTNKNLSP